MCPRRPKSRNYLHDSCELSYFYITAYAWALSHTFSLQWDMQELSGHPKSASQRWLVLGVRGSEEKIRFYSSSDVDCPQNALMWIYSGDYGKTKYAKELELLGLSSGDRATSKNFQCMELLKVPRMFTVSPSGVLHRGSGHAHN